MKCRPDSLTKQTNKQTNWIAVPFARGGQLGIKGSGERAVRQGRVAVGLLGSAQAQAQAAILDEWINKGGARGNPDFVEACMNCKNAPNKFLI